MEELASEVLEREFARLGWKYDPEREPSPDHLKAIKFQLEQPLSTITFTAPQLIGYNYGITHRKFILSLDKGMGKTVLYLAVGLNGEPERVILVCPTNAMAAQRREILRHFPFYADKFVFVRGQAHQRFKQWRKDGARIFICTAATLQADTGGRLKKRGETATTDVIAPPWVLSSHLDHLNGDEFQKYLRRRSSMWEQWKKLQPQNLILDSGSPVSSGPHELWPALNLCDHKFWSSYWKYVDMWCVTEDAFRGKGKVPIGPKNVDKWRNAVAPYVFHRRKDPRDYPPKSRFLMDVELPDWQRKIHDTLREELWAFTEGGDIISARNSLDALYRARLALICPKVLDASWDVGAGIEAIADDGEDLSHYVLSTPFRAPIPHLKAYLESRGRRVWILMGGLGISPDEQDRIIREFQEIGGTLIQTTKYATSYEFISGPEHHYVLGIEYDPEDNKQAEDRMQRISSTRPSFHWYIRFLDTYDEDIVEKVVIKGQNVRHLMDNGRYWAEAGLK
jgi:hypothetical protein